MDEPFRSCGLLPLNLLSHPALGEGHCALHRDGSSGFRGRPLCLSQRWLFRRRPLPFPERSAGEGIGVDDSGIPSNHLLLITSSPHKGQESVKDNPDCVSLLHNPAPQLLNELGTSHSKPLHGMHSESATVLSALFLMHLVSQ